MATKLPEFIPILTSFTARVGGRSLDELLMSPAGLARAIAETQKLVSHDGVLCLYYASLLVAACLNREKKQSPGDQPAGVRLRSAEDIPRAGQFSVVLEAIRILRHQLPSNALIFAALAGPGLLFSELRAMCESSTQRDSVDGEYASSVIVSAVRSALKSGADGIALIERVTGTTPPELLSSHKTIRKVVDFYGSTLLLFQELGSDHPDASSHAHCIFTLCSQESACNLVVGRVGPTCTSEVVPVTTAGDLPAETPVEELLEMKARIPEVQRIQAASGN
jgi:hypothetical protein